MNNDQALVVALSTGDKLRIPIYRSSKAVPLPEYKTKGSVGCDLAANIEHPLEIPPHVCVTIPTGIHIALPELPAGYEAQVRPRSSISRRGLIMPVGTVDSDYRGELGVVLANITVFPERIMPGERIAQLVIASVILAGWQEVESPDGLGTTERGSRGFGSTGR